MDQLVTDFGESLSEEVTGRRDDLENIACVGLYTAKVAFIALTGAFEQDVAIDKETLGEGGRVVREALDDLDDQILDGFVRVRRRGCHWSNRRSGPGRLDDRRNIIESGKSSRLFDLECRYRFHRRALTAARRDKQRDHEQYGDSQAGCGASYALRRHGDSLDRATEIASSRTESRLRSVRLECPIKPWVADTRIVVVGG